ncbi:hypothetical protein ACSQ76_03505 [Roseovarius sp. B08]|uniref:hypothetical protein n=1 Tax=Roseovarius sp. B08 TaxID=3449223 RepID=UPI003EDC7BFE
MRLPVLIPILAVAACATPGPEFSGVSPVRTKMGASVFDIRVAGRRAEAIRLNPQPAMRLSSVGVPAVLAIERVSGCRVDRLSGDQAMMRATLDCGAGAPAPKRRETYLECDAFELDADGGELICYPF